MNPSIAFPAFLRRLGPDPHLNGQQTVALAGCPDLLELADGSFAVIGIDITEKAKGQFPASVGCGPDERVVWIPRKTLVLAKGDKEKEAGTITARVRDGKGGGENLPPMSLNEFISRVKDEVTAKK